MHKCDDSSECQRRTIGACSPPNSKMRWNHFQEWLILVVDTNRQIKLVNIFNESIIISFACYFFFISFWCVQIPQKMLRVLLSSRMIMKFIDRPSCFLPHFDCCVCVNSMLALTLEANENGMCMTWQDDIHSIVTVTWTLRQRIVFVQNL